MNLVYRLAQSDDFRGIDELKKKYGGLIRSEAQWRWEYVDKPGLQSVLMVAEDKDSIVATYAYHPHIFRCGSRIFLTAKAEEAFFHPVLRGKGIFGLMNQRLFSFADEDKIEALWGITGARRALSAVGFEIPYSIIRYRISLSLSTGKNEFWPREIAKTFKNMVGSDLSFLLPKSISYRKGDLLTGVDDVLDLEFISDVWKSVTRKFPEMVSIDRSLAYLEWRLIRNPWVKHNMIRYVRSSSDRGYLVYSINQKGGCKVVDAMAVGQSRKVFRTMYEALIHRAHEMNCHEIADFFLGNGCILDIQRHKAMQSLLFIRRPLHSGFVYRKNPNIQKSPPYLDVSLWYFTGLFLEGVS